ncbi:MAG: hypothetical protein HZA32_20420 [Opitutae bacterium]|nr:hypothetical protein [Opitutae bacterium]
MAHEAGLPVTILLHYHDLFEEAVLSDARHDAEKFGDEIGLALHRFSGPGMETGGANQFWLLPLDRKRAILEKILIKWREVFGRGPVSVAAYLLDAASLRLLRELGPEIETVVAGCFEEGVRVYHGCNHSWYLFSEGMPWGPWYPSKTHSLRPAESDEDAVGLVALPHLVRDMSLSYEGRNDFWASHPPNVIRGMGNQATWCPYDLNLIDQFRLQERFNPWPGYLNTFVSPPWLTWSTNFEDPPEVAQTLYRNQLRYLAQLRDSGEVLANTMSEYGRWFRKNRQVGDHEVYWAKEILYGSGKHYLWHIDATMRVLIDCAQGGSIGDLRPYIGKVAMDTGPDTERQYIASYPYLIQSQHRSGAAFHSSDGSRTTAIIRRNGETFDLASCKTHCAKCERTDEGTRFLLAPTELRFADGRFIKIETEFFLPGDGRIRISRRLLESTLPGTDVLELTEYLKGSWGFTEYPERMDSVTLHAGDKSLAFAYRGSALEHPSAGAVAASIPPLRVTVSLEAGDTAKPQRSRVAEGHLFSPYFTLEVSYSFKSEEILTSWIHLKPIA